MINLKEQLHEGCTVHFRCGGSSDTADGASNSDVTVFENDGFIRIYFNGLKINYANDGTVYNCSNGDNPFDIVKIDPKPFDWKDVKQGMAFKDVDGDVWYYVAEDFRDNDLVVVCEDSDCKGFYNCPKAELTRYEEGDLK